VSDVGRLIDRHVFLDVETTGLDASADEVIEIGAVFVVGGEVEREASWLIRPTCAVPALIEALTGLSTDALAGAPSLEELWPQLDGAFDGYTVVAHNAAFERAFLKGLIDEAPVLDSCELALILFPELPSHALDALVRWLGLGAGARHRALADAHDTLRVVLALLERARREGQGWALSQVAGRLPAGPLHRLLTGLSRLEANAVPAAKPRPHPRASLPETLALWADAPHPAALELEVDDAAGLAWSAAERVKGSTWLVASQAQLRALPHAPRLPSHDAVPSEARLRALLSRRVVLDPALAAAMAYLERWANRGRKDVGTWSGFWRDRVPLFEPMRTLVRTVAAVRPPEGALAGSVAEVGRWLEAGVAPDALIWLDASSAPELERRRLTTTVDVASLRRLPELFELAAPGRPITPALLAVNDSARALATHLEAFTKAVGLERSGDGPWPGLRERLLATGRELSTWADELANAPSTPLLDGLAEEAARTVQALQRVAASEDDDEVWASRSAVWCRPSLAAAEASVATLAARAPSLFLSDVHRADSWAARLKAPAPLRVGQASAARPLCIRSQLSDDAALAEAALTSPGPITVLSAEPLPEPLVRALLERARSQRRQVRLHVSGAGPRDVVLQEWWGLGPLPRIHGDVVLLGGGHRFALRRVLAANERLEALLLRTTFDPDAWGAALVGLSWFEARVTAPVAVHVAA
jgi:DNA polymerase III epsilon subunit-like protein